MNAIEHAIKRFAEDPEYSAVYIVTDDRHRSLLDVEDALPSLDLDFKKVDFGYRTDMNNDWGGRIQVVEKARAGMLQGKKPRAVDRGWLILVGDVEDTFQELDYVIANLKGNPRFCIFWKREVAS